MAIIQYNKGKTTIYTTGESISGLTASPNTYYLGVDVNTGNFEKLNPDGNVVDIETGGRTTNYKSYTALLTQSGGNSVIGLGSGNLTIGTTYEITGYVSGDDFTNVGAPSNTVGVKFVATGTVPAAWTNKGTELQYNAGAPVVTLLENTLDGVPTYSYVGVGTYSINLDSTFVFGKTVVTIGQGDVYYANGGFYYELDASTMPNAITFTNIQSSTDNIMDDLLYNTPIEIKVYN
jgi:hypothetical protein